MSFVLPLKEGLFQLKQGTFGFQVDITPLKINMEHNHRGLEDHFPL